MPRGASPKREREFKELEKKFEEEGRYKGREEEVAARIVNKQRAERGETKAARQGRAGGASSRRKASSSSRRRAGASSQRKGAGSQRKASSRSQPKRASRSAGSRSRSRKVASRTARSRSGSASRSKQRGSARAGSRRPARAVGAARRTTDHDEIRAWVESKGGCPATVKRTEKGGEPGILRIDYTGFSGQDTLEKISWDDFFKKFDEEGLEFIYQDRTKSGRPSRFSKLIRRRAEGGAARRARSSQGARSRQRRAASSGGRARAAKRDTGRRQVSRGRQRSARTARSQERERPSRSARASSRSRSSGGAEVTTDHDEIKRWVEERGGCPATVKRTEGKRGEPGILRIDYPGYSGQDTLEEISWDDFFEKFDEQNLAFLHQDRTRGGKPSRFSKLISREHTLH